MPNRIRRIAVMGLATLTGACTQWQPQLGPVAEVVSANRGQEIRVVRRDGAILDLTDARMIGDTLSGASIRGTDTLRLRLAPEEIARLEVRKADAASTVALVVVGLGVVVGGGLLIAAGSYENTCCSSGLVRAAP